MGISVNNNPSDESPVVFVGGDGDDEEDPLSNLEMMKFDGGEDEEDQLDLEITRLPSQGRKKAVGLRKRRVRPRKADRSKLSVPLR